MTRIKEHAAMYYPRDPSGFLRPIAPIGFLPVFSPNGELSRDFPGADLQGTGPLWTGISQHPGKPSSLRTGCDCQRRDTSGICHPAYSRNPGVRLSRWMRPTIAPACGDRDTPGLLPFPWDLKNEPCGNKRGRKMPMSAGFFP